MEARKGVLVAKVARGMIWFETDSGIVLQKPTPWAGEWLRGYEAKAKRLRKDLETYERLEWYFVRGARYE